MNEQSFTLQIDGATALADKSNLFFGIYVHNLEKDHTYRITSIEFVKDRGARTLTSIAVKTAPTKLTYYVGDAAADKTFTAAGLVVTNTYTYNNATTSTTDYTYVAGPSNPSNGNLFTFSAGAVDLTTAFTTPAASLTVTVTFMGKSATFNIVVNSGATPPPVVDWEPAILSTTPINDTGKYIGQFGIQRLAEAGELTLAAVDGGFTMTVTSGNYKQVSIQVGAAAGGSANYATDGFTAVSGTTYTITCMVSIASGTGTLRAGPNNNTGNWPNTKSLTTTPAEFKFSWTQGTGEAGGNLLLDTGNTGLNNAIKITDIKITHPGS